MISQERKRLEKRLDMDEDGRLMNKRLVIIDGNSLINRAYYAMQRPMITHEGIYTQGIFGFINMLNKIETDYPPAYIAVAWDRKEPTFRHERYKDYKAGRRRMPEELAMELPLMRDILSAMNISNLSIDGYEADDIIGTVARAGEEAGLEPLIITGDRDALQLASERTKVLITKKGLTEFELYDRDRMRERYQMSPEQFIDLKGLMGDKSDNIPGIPGIGEVTGIKLIKAFGSVKDLIERSSEIRNDKLRAKVEEYSQQAMMSRMLAEIDRDVPIDFSIEELKVKAPDKDRLIDLYTRLEFNRFLRNMHVAESGGSSGSPGDTASEEAPERFRVRSVQEISSVEQLARLDQIGEGEEVAVSVVSDGSHVSLPSLEAIALVRGGQCFYISGSPELIGKALEILNKKDLRFTGHDLIRSYYVLIAHGLERFETAFDTRIAQYVLDASGSDYSLKILMLKYFHEDIGEPVAAAADGVQLDMLGSSAADDRAARVAELECVLSLRALQEQKIKSDGLSRVYEEIELPLIKVMASMESAGFRVRAGELRNFGASLKAEIEGLRSRIYELAGEEFNVNSTKQLGEILFEKLGLRAGKKTKSGYSTNAETLERLRGAHPVIELILRFRQLSKLNSTYVDGLIPLIAEDGKLRAHFQQTVTQTGRISCTEPNLQNIPVRNEFGRQLRKAFVPDGKGDVLISADYSQIELRILAHLSGDPDLIGAFNSGADIHRSTAARVFGLRYEDVTPLDRSRAKAVNFGVIYGMSGFGLAEELHISRRDAEQYILDYFAKHRPVKEYMDEQVALCKARGYSETITGRRRYIHEISSGNRMVRSLGERLAMNSPIQGSAADIIKIAMIRVYEELRRRSMKSRLILQIHDELIINAVPGEIDEVKELLIRNMREAMDLKVELVAELGTGRTWYELK